MKKQIVIASVGVVLVVAGIVAYNNNVFKSSHINSTGDRNTAGERNDASATSTVIMPKNSGVTFKCSNGSSFTLESLPVMTLTLKDSQGERKETLTVKPGDSKYAVFQNKSGSVIYTSMGQTATVEENGEETFSNCVGQF